MRVAIRPLQLIQESAAQLDFNIDLPHNTLPLPPVSSLQWLPVAALIQLKSLVLAYSAANGSGARYVQVTGGACAPQPVHYAVRLPSGPLLPSPTSLLFAVLAPPWWNELPTDIGPSSNTDWENTTSKHTPYCGTSSSFLITFLSTTDPHTF